MSAVSFDPNDPETLKCPYAHYKAMRESDPVHRVEPEGYYLITRSADIESVSKNTEVFRNDVRSFYMLNERLKGIYQAAPVLSTADGAQHQRTRQLVNRAFTPSRVQALEPDIQTIVDGLIDRFIAAGRAEILHDFAIPLPVWVIADQLGIPREDLPKFKAWSDAIVTPTNPFASEAERDAAPALIAEHNEYFKRLFAERRRDPRGDIISTLVAPPPSEQGEAREALTEDELLSIIQQLLSAGNETTTNAISNGIMQLAKDAVLQDRLRGDPSLIRAFCEEVLRFEAPQQGLWRYTTQDAVVAGVTIPAGSFVNLRYVSGNRDAAKYEAPDQFRIDRSETSHLAFGFGIHTCVGSQLARKEMEVAFKTVLRRLANIRLAADRPAPEFVPNFIVRCVKELHVTFSPAAP